MKPYQTPLCRIVDWDMEQGFLTGSTESYPIDPFDPEFDG